MKIKEGGEVDLVGVGKEAPLHPYHHLAVLVEVASRSSSSPDLRCGWSKKHINELAKKLVG